MIASISWTQSALNFFRNTILICSQIFKLFHPLEGTIINPHTVNSMYLSNTTLLGQPNPVHIPTSHLLEIHPNIIHRSSLGLPSGLFPSGFPTKTLYTPSPHPYTPHAQPISFFSILSELS